MAGAMIERIARILCAREGRDPDEICIGAGAATGQTWTGWQAFATEADDILAAMREPTRDMLRAVDYDWQAEGFWQSMIDAARDR